MIYTVRIHVPVPTGTCHRLTVLYVLFKCSTINLFRAFVGLRLMLVYLVRSFKKSLEAEQGQNQVLTRTRL